jgi:hypothetical protein
MVLADSHWLMNKCFNAKRVGLVSADLIGVSSAEDDGNTLPDFNEFSGQLITSTGVSDVSLAATMAWSI